MRRSGILFIGGGTAGHIYPLIAISEQLPRELDLRYFGNPEGFRNELIAAGIKVQTVITSKWRRYFSFKNILDLFKFFIGFFQALWKVFWFMPDVAFSKGGPGALSIVLACRFYRVPLIIHESDSVPGITTRRSAKAAAIIEIGFPEAAKTFSNISGIVKVVGNPVRKVILDVRRKEDARDYFGLDPIAPVLLVLGGSQGADRLNTFIIDHLNELLEVVQIIHQAGQRNYQSIVTSLSGIKSQISPALFKRYKVFDYLGGEDYSLALDAAEIALTRAGAGALTEVAIKGLPAIVVPLPGSAQNHQVKNAYEYGKAGGALVVEEENLLPSLVIRELKSLLTDQKKREKMKRDAQAFFKLGAAEAIARDILSLT